MLSGQRLFDGETISHTLADVLRAPIDFDKLPRETPRAVRNLLKRCLDRDVKTRLRDIGEARVIISRVGKEPEAPVIAAATASLGRLPWIAAGLMTAVAAVALWAPWRSEKPVDRPLVRLDVNLGPDAIPGAGSSVAISPDGSRIVFPIRAAAGKPMLATQLLDQAAITPLPGTENGSYPFFSPTASGSGFTRIAS